MIVTALLLAAQAASSAAGPPADGPSPPKAAFEQAVACAAALQVAALAAPAWARDPVVVAAANAWLARAFETAEAGGARPEETSARVRAAMAALVDDAAEAGPDDLSRRAQRCVETRPGG